MKSTIKKAVCFVLVIGLVATMAFALAACNNDKSDWEYIKNKGTLVCGITLYEPMNYIGADGDLTGFDTEFAEKVAQELGIEAKFQIIKWNSRNMELNAKNIDAIWNGFTVNEVRKGEVEFSRSYLHNNQCVVVRASDLAAYTDASVLQGRTAAVEAGSAGEIAAKQLAGSGNVIGKGAQTDCLLEVSSNQVQFAVIDLIMAQKMVGRGDYSNLAIATAIELEPEKYAIGFRKGSDMAAKVNAVIDKLIENGFMAELAEKYNLSEQLVTE